MINKKSLLIINLLVLASCNGVNDSVSVSDNASTSESLNISSNEVSSTSESLNISSNEVSSTSQNSSSSNLESSSSEIITKNEEFERFIDDFFVSYLGNDYLSWNIFTINPSDFGFVDVYDSTPNWYFYSKVTNEDIQDTYNYYKNLDDTLNDFDVNTLTSSQLVSYDGLKEMIAYGLEYYDLKNNYNPLMEFNYIDQFGGEAANVVSYMESYSFWNEQDIKNALSYIKSLPNSFKTYINYCQDRIDASYPLSDYTLNAMINYLNNITNLNGQKFYLIDVMKEKVNACGYLTANEKSKYCTLFEEYINNYLLIAFKNLANGLSQFKGKCSKEGYLASYGEQGKKYYTYLLRNQLGIFNLDMDEYGKYLKETLDKYANELDDITSYIYSEMSDDDYDKFEEYQNGKSVINENDPYKMLDYLKNFSTSIVEPLKTTPTINIKYMDEATAKSSNALAYYTKSALDNYESENITLNGESLKEDYNETLSTLAHEGYPGHLYDYVYSKQQDISSFAKINSNLTSGEGWANYVSYKLFEYISDNSNDEVIKYYCQYYNLNTTYGYLAYTYFDYGIHYLSWSVNDFKNVLQNVGFDSSYAQDLYRLLIEMPGEYAAYGYGMCYFIDIHNQAKDALKNNYNEIEFNKLLLKDGWISLDRISKKVREYIK